MSTDRIFALRTYIVNPGKLQALHARFRDHTCRLLQRHGIEVIGLWTAADGGGDDTLTYLLAFPDRPVADAMSNAFGDDPEWVRVRDESERDGPLIARITAVFLNPTDYSPGGFQ